MKDLLSFLDQKPLYYEQIDYERFPKIYQRIRHHFILPKTIHIVGTNGKGTTGRFLAQMLHAQGFHVGHYTSPHILNFNERIWLDGEEADDALLEMTHLQLSCLLSEEDAAALSYFEYTTLLAMLLFSTRCDYIVFEAGLGGEFDATNVFPKILSIITPIGYDHQSFLGNTIEEIAITKLNSITDDFILAPQVEPKVMELALHKAQSLGKKLIIAQESLLEEKRETLKAYANAKGYPHFLYENLLTAYCALTFLGYDMMLNSLEFAPLKGRYFSFLPNVRLDVGHNPMAAHALVEAMGDKKVILVYNSYADKAYDVILKILKPIIVHVEILGIEHARMVDSALLTRTIHALGLEVKSFKGIDLDREYLVFGSFSVIETFLKGYRER